jgi:phage gp46-like protein
MAIRPIRNRQHKSSEEIMDIAVAWNIGNGYADWQQAGADLATGPSLHSAIYISLFTDRLASTDDIIRDGTGDRRGWWGDLDQQLIGSRLWLLDRAKQVPGVLQLAHDYITEALQWLISDGVVQRFDITVQWIGRGRLGALIIATRPDGSAETFNYAWAWKGIA